MGLVGTCYTQRREKWASPPRTSVGLQQLQNIPSPSPWSSLLYFFEFGIEKSYIRFFKTLESKNPNYFYFRHKIQELISFQHRANSTALYIFNTQVALHVVLPPPQMASVIFGNDQMYVENIALYYCIPSRVSFFFVYVICPKRPRRIVSQMETPHKSSFVASTNFHL